MKKTELVKLLAITLTFTVLAVSAFTAIAYAAYPGPDEKEDINGGFADGVKSRARGIYQTGSYYDYKDSYHYSERWAGWGNSLVGYLTVRFWSDKYDTGFYEYTSGDSVGGSGQSVWCDYVASYSYSDFSGWGQDWSRSCSSTVVAQYNP